MGGEREEEGGAGVFENQVTNLGHLLAAGCFCVLLSGGKQRCCSLLDTKRELVRSRGLFFETRYKFGGRLVAQSASVRPFWQWGLHVGPAALKHAWQERRRRGGGRGKRRTAGGLESGAAELRTTSSVARANKNTVVLYS